MNFNFKLFVSNLVFKDNLKANVFLLINVLLHTLIFSFIYEWDWGTGLFLLFLRCFLDIAMTKVVMGILKDKDYLFQYIAIFISYLALKSVTLTVKDKYYGYHFLIGIFLSVIYSFIWWFFLRKENLKLEAVKGGGICLVRR